MHPTIVAKTVNQNIFRSLYQNQLYWRVDKDTVLARFYLMFMLCIHPERVVRMANTYCDYGFAPELCPSFDLVYLTDSDDFFMLETQARRHEFLHIRLGTHHVRDIAGYLSEWTTREHRHYARENLIFHAAHVPEDLQTFVAEAGEMVRELEEMLPLPRPHAFHPYWVGSLPLWKREVERHGGASHPQELHLLTETPVKQTWTGRIFAFARQVARGTHADLRIWQAGWLDQRLVERVLDAANPHSRTLIVASATNLSGRRMSRRQTIVNMTYMQALRATTDPKGQERYQDAFIFLRPEDLTVGAARHPIELLSLVKAKGQLVLIVQDPGNEFMPASLAEPLLGMLARTFNSDRVEASVEFNNGNVQRRIRLGVRRLGQFYLRLGWMFAPLLAIGGLVLLAANVLNHARSVMRGNTTEEPDYCGTMLVKIRRS
jgi:hypothetical protein